MLLITLAGLDLLIQDVNLPVQSLSYYIGFGKGIPFFLNGMLQLLYTTIGLIVFDLDILESVINGFKL